MYSTCVYCQGALGANESVEAFPVGRTLAFDAARGRLWVVCPRCSRWCLSPLEERWEAIEACERLYRDTPTRASTDQIGLAKLADGTQLVRVGSPTRPEFAAWRYGQEFVRRRRKAIAVAGTIGAASIGISVLKIAGLPFIVGVPLVGAVPQLVNVWNLYQLFLRPVARVRYRDELVTLRATDLGSLRLEADERGGWQLNVLHRLGRSIVTGTEGERLLGRVLTRLNEGGGKQAMVDGAVRELVDAGSPEAYIRRYIASNAALTQRRSWREPSSPQVLALEMALHEATERVALEGELTALTAAWQEAEEIAAISDTLLLPSWVEEKLRR